MNRLLPWSFGSKTPPKTRRTAVFGLLILTLITGLPPLILVPAASKPDERYHWAYAVQLARTGALPAGTPADNPAYPEAHQPPLYYFVSAVLSRNLADPDAFAQQSSNPFFLSTPRGNRNSLVLGAEAQSLFLVGRLVSYAFWLALPLAAFWAWRPLLGTGTSLAAGSLLALVPLLSFVGTAYSNDMASVTFLAVALGAVIRLLDARSPGHWRWASLYGVALGASMLCKIYALPLIAGVGAVACAPFVPLDRKRRLQLLAGLALAGVMVAPWAWSNYQRFGDPLGMTVFANVMGDDPHWWRLSRVLVVVVQAWRTFWADLGPGGLDTIPMPVAAALGLVEIFALAGAASQLRRLAVARTQRSLLWVFALWILLSIASFVWTFMRTRVTVISGGRNLLYLQLLNAPLLIIGLSRWFGSPRRAHLAVVGLGLAMTAWAWGYLLYAYPYQPARPVTLPSGSLASFGEPYALLDWHLRPDGDQLHLDFTLAKIHTDDEPRAYFIQVTAPDGSQIANLNTLPAHGAYATNYWPEGTALDESYALAPAALVPDGATVSLGMWSLVTEDRLPARDAQGTYLADAAYSVPWPSD